MGATAVRQAEQILTHTETVVAIEMMSAAQGIDFRLQDHGGKLGAGTQAAYDTIRQCVPFIDGDTYMAPLIEQVRVGVESAEIKEAVEAIIGG